MSKQKQLVKAACAVRTRLLARQQRESFVLHHQLGPATDAARRLDRLRRKLELAERGGWTGAARRLREQVRRTMDQLHTEVLQVARLTDQASPRVPTLRTLVESLEQLESEFGNWRYDSRTGELVVTTGVIELEGVYLGPFEIHLHVFELDEVGRGEALSVVALDPHPARGGTGVTHPHVSDERICLGEATQSVRQALRGGDLCELFLLVRSVLETYNPDSPYVALDDWDGVPCFECGEIAREGEAVFCEGCERDFCDQCIDRCEACETMLCLGCLCRCEVCDQPVCEECLRRCAACEQPCCENCLVNGLCPSCEQERKEQIDEHANEDDESDPTDEEEAEPTSIHAQQEIREQATSDAERSRDRVG